MKQFSSVLIAGVFFLCTLGVTGCSTVGTAAKQTGHTAGHAVEGAGHVAGEAVEDTGEAVNKTAHKAKEEADGCMLTLDAGGRPSTLFALILAAAVLVARRRSRRPRRRLPYSTTS